MNGQTNLSDFMSLFSNGDRHELTNKSKHSYVKFVRYGDEISVEIYYKNEAMLCRVPADKLKEYVRGI